MQVPSEELSEGESLVQEIIMETRTLVFGANWNSDGTCTVDAPSVEKLKQLLRRFGAT